MVAVAVRDVRLVLCIIDENLGWLAERPRIVAAGVGPSESFLLDELAVLREFQDLTVVATVAADPDVALAVNEDAVVRFGPFVRRPPHGSAPGGHEISGLIELQDR